MTGWGMLVMDEHGGRQMDNGSIPWQGVLTPEVVWTERLGLGACCSQQNASRLHGSLTLIIGQGLASYLKMLVVAGKGMTPPLGVHY